MFGAFGGSLETFSAREQAERKMGTASRVPSFFGDTSGADGARGAGSAFSPGVPPAGGSRGNPEEGARDPRRPKLAWITRMVQALPLAFAFLVLVSCTELPPTGRVLDQVSVVRDALEDPALPPEKRQAALAALDDVKEAVVAWEIHDAQGDFPVDVSPVEIRLSFATAAADWDRDGYDDGIDLRVHPKDKYGDTVKAAGSFDIELKRPPLLDLPGSQPTSICRWHRDAQQTNSAWVDGTFSGFYFKLEWLDTRPESGIVMIDVTYTSPLGRTLTASKGDIEVRMREEP